MQDGSGHLDLRGFLSLWTAACHLRTLQCIEYLVYLGYAGGNLAAADSAIKVCASRATDYKRRVTSRTVFEVLLCCARGVDAAEVALGMLTRQRPAALSAPLPSTASPSDEGGGAAGNLLVDLLVVDAVHTSRAAAGGAPGKAGRSEPGPDAASPLSPPPPVHLLVRPVSLEEGQLLLQGERDLVDEGGSAHDAGAPRHRVARKARHCIDAVVLAFDAADPASARACVGVREQMEKDELRMPCLMAGVAHLPPWSPDLSRHAQPAPATPALPATPATPAPVDASLNASVASLPAAAAGGGGVASVSLFCAVLCPSLCLRLCVPLCVPLCVFAYMSSSVALHRGAARFGSRHAVQHVVHHDAQHDQPATAGQKAGDRGAEGAGARLGTGGVGAMQWRHAVPSCVLERDLVSCVLERDEGARVSRSAGACRLIVCVCWLSDFSCPRGLAGSGGGGEGGPGSGPDDALASVALFCSQVCCLLLHVHRPFPSSSSSPFPNRAPAPASAGQPLAL